MLCRVALGTQIVHSFVLAFNTRHGVVDINLGKSRKVMAAAIDKRFLLFFHLRQRRKRRPKYLKRYWVREIPVSKQLSSEWIPYSGTRNALNWPSHSTNTYGWHLKGLIISFLVLARCSVGEEIVVLIDSFHNLTPSIFFLNCVFVVVVCGFP